MSGLLDYLGDQDQIKNAIAGYMAIEGAKSSTPYPQTPATTAQGNGVANPSAAQRAAVDNTKTILMYGGGFIGLLIVGAIVYKVVK